MRYEKAEQAKRFHHDAFNINDKAAGSHPHLDERGLGELQWHTGAGRRPSGPLGLRRLPEMVHDLTEIALAPERASPQPQRRLI
jgi:hypothetical protein